jgi:hypothetical protein
VLLLFTTLTLTALALKTLTALALKTLLALALKTLAALSLRVRGKRLRASSPSQGLFFFRAENGRTRLRRPCRDKIHHHRRKNTKTNYFFHLFPSFWEITRKIPIFRPAQSFDRSPSRRLPLLAFSGLRLMSRPLGYRA